MSDHTKVGELREGNEPRDAIHIAVAPVVASVAMKPGEHIGFVGEGCEEVGPCEWAMSIGIVDPFLVRNIRPGDRFWMFLHPNTITSLRHNWTHPAFGEDNRSHADVAQSEGWLRDYLDGNGPEYDKFMAAVQNGGKWEDPNQGDYCNIRIDGEYIFVGGHDAHGEVPEGFWDHVETVVGRKLPFRRATQFSCSC